MHNVTNWSCVMYCARYGANITYTQTNIVDRFPFMLSVSAIGDVFLREKKGVEFFYWWYNGISKISISMIVSIIKVRSNKMPYTIIVIFLSFTPLNLIM